MKKIDAFRAHLIRSGLESLASGMVWTAMFVYQIEVVGLTPLQLVLIGTTMEITVFLFEIPTGVVADVYSRRLSVIIGFFLIGISYLIQGGFPLFEALLLGQVIWGIGFTFTSGAYEAWLVDELGQNQVGNAFIRGAQASRILGLAGIGVSAVLGSLDLRIPILLGGALTVVISGFLLLFMPETGFAPAPAKDRATWQSMIITFREGVGIARGRPTLIIILAISVFYGLYSEGWDRLWQMHLIENIGFPTFMDLQPVVWIGGINVIETFLALGAAETMRRKLNMSDARAMTRALLIMTVLMIISLTAYGLSHSFVFAMAAFFVFATTRGLVDPVFNTWSNQHIDSRVRATALSLRSQTDAIGQLAGGPPLGAIGQISLRAAFLASAAILSPVLWLYRLARKPVERQPARA